MELLTGLMPLNSMVSNHLDRGGGAQPMAKQGFRLFTRIDFTLIQCHVTPRIMELAENSIVSILPFQNT
jgi:hypothetical protein